MRSNLNRLLNAGCGNAVVANSFAVMYRRRGGHVCGTRFKLRPSKPFAQWQKMRDCLNDGLAHGACWLIVRFLLKNFLWMSGQNSFRLFESAPAPSDQAKFPNVSLTPRSSPG
jgi:hypothetical protein